MYAEVAELVREKARTTKVAFAVQGGPSWYDSIVHLLVNACASDGTPCRLIAGVSAVEGVLTRLRQSIAPSLLITDAASVVDGRTALDAGRPTLIVQPHVAMSEDVLSGVATPRATIQALGASLAKTYPLNHDVFAVALVGEWADERLFTVAIGDLEAGEDLDLRGASLFVPQSD